jgi:hypothetical protein
MILSRFRWNTAIDAIASVDMETDTTVIDRLDESLNIVAVALKQFDDLCGCDHARLRLQIKVVLFPMISSNLDRLLNAVFRLAFSAFANLRNDEHRRESLNVGKWY